MIAAIELLHSRLIKHKISVSLAESCTGGLLSAMLTKCAGSSEYFKGSVVTYSNEAKSGILNVSIDILSRYGAVSEEVAIEMLIGCGKLFQSDIVCSITGVAGPGGGSKDKPVGTVYIGVKYMNDISVERCFFTGNREDIRVKSSERAVYKLLELFKDE
jgi:PncC family amidohydrolase